MVEPPWPAARRAAYALALLFVAYAFAFVDRTILTLLVGPIREDLGISDTPVSLLHGFAFAIFYTFVGIPVARVADRGSRRSIISPSALAWSVACGACGLARSFPQLLLGRIGVGIGEAGLSPAAYSMLADLFPPHRLGLAMSIFVSALYVGAGISLIGLVSVVGSGPAGALAFLTHARHGFEGLFGVMLFSASMAFGAAAAGLTTLNPNRMRAQASAAYLFALNLLAVGMGPTAAALLTDQWFHDDLQVGRSVSVVICVAAPLALVALTIAGGPFMVCAALNDDPDARYPDAVS
jgi:MFS family permease